MTYNAHDPERRPRVVLADDDAFHSELVAVWLDMEGFDVVRFDSGDALLAWTRAATEPAAVDAILLDVEMPGRDGFATRAALMEQARFAATPILMVSGMCPETLERRAAAAGVPAVCKDAAVLPRLADWLRSATSLGAQYAAR